MNSKLKIALATIVGVALGQPVCRGCKPRPSRKPTRSPNWM